MLRNLTLACLGMGLCTFSVFAQVPDSTSTSSGPSAWVYVSSYIGNTDKTEVHAYTAAASGALSPIEGSPFDADVTSMAVNGLYLFGAETSGTFIDSYAIESNGGLHYLAEVNSQAENKCNSSPTDIVLDHTGASLYNFDYWGDSICSNSIFQSYNMVKSTGALTYTGETSGSQNLVGPLTVSSNNGYLYTSDCYHFGATISGFKRGSNGTLTQLSYSFPFPPGGWCPSLAAADPNMHLAIPMYPSDGYGDVNGPYQIASYTIQSDGNLTTTSTAANMPTTAFTEQNNAGYINNLSMLPSGKLLAVAGSEGLEVLHFNGADPATKYTGLLTTNEVYQMFWDNNNHLYAIGSGNKLWVWTITPTSAKLTANYTINRPAGIIVQPLPLPWK